MSRETIEHRRGISLDSAAPVLSINNVSLTFGGIAALTDVTFTMSTGVVCGLIGPNGAGKTSLFNCITGFYAPRSGNIMFEGQSMVGRRPDEAAGLGIARTFQNIGLVKGLTVLDNVLTGAFHRSTSGFIPTLLGLPSVRRQEAALTTQALEILNELGLDSIAHHLAEGLPYGTLKRIELAKAIMSEPRLLLLDEPANGLIHDEVLELGEMIKKISTERSLSILLVEHHMGLVMSTCSEIVVMNFGQVVASGTPTQMQNHPAVIEAYLGAVAS